MKKTLLIAAAFAAIPTISVAADLPSISVDVSDIDTSTTAGMRELDRRVERAIYRACDNGMPGLGAAALEQECREDLRKAARGAVEAATRGAKDQRYALATMNTEV